MATFRWSQFEAKAVWVVTVERECLFGGEAVDEAVDVGAGAGLFDELLHGLIDGPLGAVAFGDELVLYSP